jgi:subfamily B ATP-binding cassette protein MsbA
MKVLALIAKSTARAGFSIRKLVGFDGMGRTMARLVPYIRRVWAVYAALFLLLFIDIFLMLAFTWFISTITDAAVAGETARIHGLLLFGGTLIVSEMLSVFFRTRLEAEAVNRIKRDLKNDLFHHLLRLPAGYYAARHSGDLVSRMTTDIDNVKGAIGTNLLNLLHLPLTALAAFAYLFFVHRQLALSCLFLGPAALVAAGAFGLRIRDNGRKLQARLGRINGLLHDVFAGQMVVKAFAMEERFDERFRRETEDVLNLERREARLTSWLQGSSSAISLSAWFITLGLGALFVARGTITVGELLAFVNLVWNLLYPFEGVARQWGGLQRSLAAVERLWNVLDEKPPKAAFPAYVPPVPLLEGITLDRVSFAYDGGPPAIRDLSLHIPAGQKVALVGPSGAGKSTLFQLLMGFYKPDSGIIRLDGLRHDTTDPDLWRSRFALVPQEPYLFAGTVRDNIAGGRPDATMDEIIEAARRANADEFIRALPDGYDTWIGERGTLLSGGQKQRITIARALLRDAPILLLDEATSSLDPQSEHLVKEALDRLMQGRTVIVIAHRKSALAGMDRIVVLENGRVAEDGTPEQLAAAQGAYFRHFERR